jgi:sortase A
MRRPTVIAATAGAILALLGAGGVLVVAGDEQPQRAAAPAPPAAVQEIPPSAPEAPPVAEELPLALPALPSPVPAASFKLYGLPLPAKAPTNERAPGPIIAIGEIEIPSIQVKHTVYEGITLTVVDHGPGHWPGSALPGDPGNTVFAGHRTVNSRPFHNLDLVKPGDRVVFRVGGRTSVYQITKNFVVDGSETHIALPTPQPTVTLFACHPKGSAKQRIVVQGKLLPGESA